MTANSIGIRNPETEVIGANELFDIGYWTTRWQITEAQLKEAAHKAVDNTVRNIHDTAVKLGFMNSKL